MHQPDRRCLSRQTPAGAVCVARIPAPIDGSPTSRRGFTEAVELARDRPSRLRLLHVVDESFLVFDMYATGYGGKVIRGLREAAPSSQPEEGKHGAGQVLSKACAFFVPVVDGVVALSFLLASLAAAAVAGWF